MASLKGTRTERNLLTAFAGESQARNRYNYAASRAKKDGLVQISRIFEETADQEKEQAKRLFKLLEGGEVEIRAAFSAGVIGSTAENLHGAAAGENHEWTQMYPEFAEIARRGPGWAAAAPRTAPHPSQPTTSCEERAMEEYVCAACGYVYDPQAGDPAGGVEPGTPFKELPDDWSCPACGVGKGLFVVQEAGQAS